jgi:hypothetical protein
MNPNTFLLSGGNVHRSLFVSGTTLVDVERVVIVKGVVGGFVGVVVEGVVEGVVGGVSVAVVEALVDVVVSENWNNFSQYSSGTFCFGSRRTLSRLSCNKSHDHT